MNNNIDLINQFKFQSAFKAEINRSVIILIQEITRKPMKIPLPNVSFDLQLRKSTTSEKPFSTELRFRINSN